MSERQCDKCGETVAASKAFCPACGHAFVDEEVRTDTSEFKMTDGTMQFSQSMYDGMLSDMGLNISKASEALNEEVGAALEQVQPVRPQPAPAAPQARPPVSTTTLKPAAPPAAAPAKSKLRMWLMIGGVVVVLWVLVVVLIIVFAVMRSV